MTTKNALSAPEPAASDNPQAFTQATAAKTTAKKATAPKGVPTPKRSAAKPKQAGTKPKFAVVEHTMKCQTSEGEISLDLRIPLRNFKAMAKLEDMPEDESFDFILEEIMPADVADQVQDLRDGAEAMHLIMQWMEAVGERFGASLGESEGSSAS